MVDVGFTHVALPVTDPDASIAFYERFAGMEVVHRRGDPPEVVVWMSDLTRPFVIVLLQMPEVTHVLGGFSHLGVACESREEVDRLCEAAGDRLLLGPVDSGPPVGYWAFLADPDGHNLELSFGQDVGLAVVMARSETDGSRTEAAGAQALPPV
ncbi:MAG: VOC family protein [Acidimicrobiia bacterium]|nr:VOC family protein [Acidimicrobiia bacterium]